jgi:thiol-disulfide isomerase/thioredoxin
MPFRRLASLPLGALVLVLVAACSSGAGVSSVAPAPASVAPGSPAGGGAESMAPESMAPESMAPDQSAAPVDPTVAPTSDAAAAALASRPWATATLTNVTTGEPFTIADLAGRTVFVESMAIWCSNCRAQQARFADALEQLDPDTVAYVVLTVDPGESAEDLARYRKDRGFKGMYAVAGKAVSKALADEFGPNAINPPSVPLVLVTPTGEITFSTGGESADEIVKLARG